METLKEDVDGKYGRMDHISKELGKIISLMGLADSSIVMVLFMKVNGNKTKLMEKEYISI
jgi:hypothetical protein